MAQPLPMLKVDPEWKCQRSGDCCTVPKEVVMTMEEAAVLVHHAPPTVKMEFRKVDERFVALKAGPCPLYAFNGCLVYSHRPYNCRRFSCLRPDVKAEPFDANGGNLLRRVAVSRVARRMAQKIQRKAQKWAIRHGWNAFPNGDGGA